MVAKKQHAKRQAKYLVCVDGEEHTKIALRYACLKAARTGAVVELMYVIDPVDFTTFAAVADTMKQEQRDKAKKLLTQLVKEAEEYCVEGQPPTKQVREGTVSGEIIEAVQEDENITMLILGAHPEGSSSRSNILPMVTAQMGESLKIPLLIVPGNLTEAQIRVLA